MEKLLLTNYDNIKYLDHDLVFNKKGFYLNFYHCYKCKDNFYLNTESNKIYHDTGDKYDVNLTCVELIIKRLLE